MCKYNFCVVFPCNKLTNHDKFTLYQSDRFKVLTNAVLRLVLLNWLKKSRQIGQYGSSFYLGPILWSIIRRVYGMLNTRTLNIVHTLMTEEEHGSVLFVNYKGTNLGLNKC